MPNSLTHSAALLDWPMLGGFLLTLTRLGLALAFVPMPGVKSAPDMARVVLIVSLAAVLVPALPQTLAVPVAPGAFAKAMAGEALYGLAVGVVVAFLGEVLTFAMQTFALQAGYSYASSIDPNSEADSGVLLVFALLCGNILFFVFGGHRLVVKAFARSLDVWPVGGSAASLAWAQIVSQLGSSMFELALRLALPVAGMLLLAEIALGVVSRLQSQLQLLSLSFPMKMLGTVVILAMLAPLWVAVYQRAFTHAVHALERMLAL
ncbi:MAG TPA: flagellar biosynthetic protein FliR [Bryobacteraceae bacterium]|nr:flagellar biosynthetic protein FliR [Bryobacteraceae bacterium]